MAHNRYFAIDSDDPNCVEIVDLCVGTHESQQPNVAKTRLIVKLHEGDHNQYDILEKYPEMNQVQAVQYTNNDEWKLQDL